MNIRSFVATAAVLVIGVAVFTNAALAQKGGQHVDVAVGTSGLDFQLPATDGKTYKLSDYFGKDKPVIVEWFNPGCPFVVKYYEGTNNSMRDARAFAEKNGVSWLSVNSGAPGMQGHGLDVNKEAAAKWGISTPILLDESGAAGMSFMAANTPQIFIFSSKGELIYNGGVDETKMADEVPQNNFVINALKQYMAGSKIDPASTPHIGCSVKYAPKEEPKTAQGSK